jgi:competence protein ComFB
LLYKYNREEDMASLGKYDFDNLRNEAETFVIKELERQLETSSEPVCHCNDCALDMAAIALNSVKPLYRVSLLGTLYTATAMTENTYASSVRDAVFLAIEKVRKNPGHEIVL